MRKILVGRLVLGLLASTFALILTPAQAFALTGDIDDDGDVDRNDLSIILGARNTPASGPDDPRDLDEDGRITVLDARKLIILCTRPRCEVLEPLSVTLEEESRVTKDISSKGTLVITTAENGTQFILFVPPEAFAGSDSPAITMAPVKSIDGLSATGSLLGAVQINVNPHEALLLKPATLTIITAEPFSLEELVGFTYKDSGQDYHLYPVSFADPTSSALTLTLSHFSGFGAGQGDANDFASQTNPQAPLSQLFQEILALVNSANGDLDSVRAMIAELARASFETDILPAMQSASSEQPFQDAVLLYVEWNVLISFYFGEKEKETEFGDQILTWEGVAAQTAENFLNHLDQECQRTPNRCEQASQLDPILSTAQTIQLLGLSEEVPFLKRNLNDICGELLHTIVNQVRISPLESRLSGDEPLVTIEAFPINTLGGFIDSSIQWSTNNSIVAAIQSEMEIPLGGSAVIQAVEIGRATITADVVDLTTLNSTGVRCGVQGTSQVIVLPEFFVDPPEAAIFLNGSVRLTAKQRGPGGEQEVNATWRSSNSAVAEVDHGLVKANTTGIAFIEATIDHPLLASPLTLAVPVEVILNVTGEWTAFGTQIEDCTAAQDDGASRFFGRVALSQNGNTVTVVGAVNGSAQISQSGEWEAQVLVEGLSITAAGRAKVGLDGDLRSSVVYSTTDGRCTITGAGTASRNP